ncbi:MAG: hypothetical protein QOH26_1897 [Actinomycetota bacterium]|nr:hypothetical protein [Actinomycetota bacterium]
MRIVREQRLLSIGSLAYLVLLLVAGIVWGRSQWPFYALFMSAVFALVAFIYERSPLSPLVLWALSIWGLTHMIGGLVEWNGDIVYQATVLPGLRFDKVVHAFGFGAATAACFQLIEDKFGADGKERTIAWFAALSGLGLGAINETIEFLIARYTAHSNVGGFLNTGWDLVANAVGATIAAVLCVRLRARSGAASTSSPS